MAWMLLCWGRMLLFTVLCVVPASAITMQAQSKKHLRQYLLSSLRNRSLSNKSRNKFTTPPSPRVLSTDHSSLLKAKNEYSVLRVLSERLQARDIKLNGTFIGIFIVTVPLALVIFVVLMLKYREDAIDSSATVPNVDRNGNKRKHLLEQWWTKRRESYQHLEEESAQRVSSSGWRLSLRSTLGKKKEPVQSSDSDSEEVSCDVVSGALKEFPDVLGPLALHHTNWNAADLKVIDEDDGEKAFTIERDAWRWSGSKDLELFAFSVATWPIKGRLGPQSSISTFPVAPQDASKVLPPGAHTFGWSNPLGFQFKHWTKNAIEEVAKSGISDVDFILRGGFVFFDIAGTICGVRTIGVVSPQHVSLWFGRPQYWHPDLTSAMRGKFAQITIADLKAKGALYYSWVGADDAVLSNEAVQSPVLPHGGFAYLFRDIAQGTSSNGVVDQGRMEDVIFPLATVRPPVYQREKGSKRNSAQYIRKSLLSFGFVPTLWEQQNSKLKPKPEDEAKGEGKVETKANE